MQLLQGMNSHEARCSDALAPLPLSLAAACWFYADNTAKSGAAPTSNT